MPGPRAAGLQVQRGPDDVTTEADWLGSCHVASLRPIPEVKDRDDALIGGAWGACPLPPNLPTPLPPPPRQVQSLGAGGRGA